MKIVSSFSLLLSVLSTTMTIPTTMTVAAPSDIVVEGTKKCGAGTVSTLDVCKPNGNIFIDSFDWKTLAQANTMKEIMFPVGWKAVDLAFKFCGECANFENVFELDLLVEGSTIPTKIFSNKEDDINEEKEVGCFVPSKSGELVLDLDVKTKGKVYSSNTDQAAVIETTATEGCKKYFVGWEDIKLPGGDADYSDLVLTVEICECKPGTHDDPHFDTFGGQHYDFQGACDLVLVDNAGYKDGKGLFIHGRTKLFGSSWSSLVGAAVMIGDDVLEVHGEDPALINGIQFPVAEVAGTEYPFSPKIGGYDLTVQVFGPHSRAHIVHMGNGEKIIINNFKEYVNVFLEKPNVNDFALASGMWGTFGTNGDMVARDGKTVIRDGDSFGREWQVRPTDPHVFHTVGDGPQYPAKCIMPQASTAEQRHLRAMSKQVTENDAKKACAKAKASQMENCVADVFGSDNLDMAGIYLVH